MKGFVSYAKCWEEFLPLIITDCFLHARWLNTLSYLENCGARKIARCEHPIEVRQEMLKHAAEESRHAYYLKAQISKLISEHELIDYKPSNIIGWMSARHYLDALDIKITRHVIREGISQTDKVCMWAYLLVTYAIEKRASELYPLYERLLRQYAITVTVKSILLEERGHLEEIEDQLKTLEVRQEIIDSVCAIESTLCYKWIKEVAALIQK